jgi:hypothetical protein
MPNYHTVPPEIVSQCLSAHPVTRDDLQHIRDRREPHRFIGTYRHRHGGSGRCRFNTTKWRARVFKFYELGSAFDNAEEAARSIVAFYKAQFGDRWRSVFNQRKVIPWRLRVVRRDGRIDGYAAEFFLRGTPVGVTQADAFGRAPGASAVWWWPTPDAAKTAARRAMQRRFERERAALAVPHPGLLFWRG